MRERVKEGTPTCSGVLDLCKCKRLGVGDNMCAVERLGFITLLETKGTLISSSRVGEDDL